MATNTARATRVTLVTIQRCNLVCMTFWTLIRRSLRFHARAHLGVVLGAAIGSAALIGALVVGDSVRGSLRQRALDRIGKTQYLLASTQSARDRCHERLDGRIPRRVPAAGIAPASRCLRQARRGASQPSEFVRRAAWVLGVLDDAETAIHIETDSVLLNQPLAAQLACLCRRHGLDAPPQARACFPARSHSQPQSEEFGGPAVQGPGDTDPRPARRLQPGCRPDAAPECVRADGPTAASRAIGWSRNLFHRDGNRWQACPDCSLKARFGLRMCASASWDLHPPRWLLERPPLPDMPPEHTAAALNDWFSHSWGAYRRRRTGF